MKQSRRPNHHSLIRSNKPNQLLSSKKNSLNETSADQKIPLKKEKKTVPKSQSRAQENWFKLNHNSQHLTEEMVKSGSSKNISIGMQASRDEIHTPEQTASSRRPPPQKHGVIEERNLLLVERTQRLRPNSPKRKQPKKSVCQNKVGRQRGAADCDEPIN